MMRGMLVAVVALTWGCEAPGEIEVGCEDLGTAGACEPGWRVLAVVDCEDPDVQAAVDPETGAYDTGIEVRPDGPLIGVWRPYGDEYRLHIRDQSGPVVLTCHPGDSGLTYVVQL